MGLEAFPRRETNYLAVERRSLRKDYSQHLCGHSETPFKHWQLEDRFMDKEMLHEVHPSTEQVAHKDINEIWLQTQRTSHVRDKTPERGRSTEDVNGEKMALILQRFVEAKRLSTDERLHHSKEFDDALEVLSSNGDLLFRLLGSQNLCELESTSPAETKCITVLKPSKMVVNDKSAGEGKKKDKQVKKPANVGQAAVWENKDHGYSPASQKVDEFPKQSTRIVVLKPSSGKTHATKAVVSPTNSSPRILQSGNFCQGPEDDDVLESRKVAKEITQQMHENIIRSHQRDETLCSSVFSNGYSGDESSFNKSDHGYAAGNLSDLEVVSALPRHSWDHVNRCGYPYSSSSFSSASCSAESSVCREAKKRLSEKWAMMASNKGPQEQRQVQRSSTLGEMLSLSNRKKSVTSEVEGINGDKEPSEFASCSRSFNEEIRRDGSPKNLLRSKSVPVSSTVYETGFSVEVCDRDAGKAHGSKEQTKSESMKSSFKGKVTSFLFSRNEKSTKKKSSLFQYKDESQSTVTETSVSPVNSPGVLRDGVSQSFNGGFFEECSLPALYESPGKTSSDSVSNVQQQAIISLEPMSKPMVQGTSSENQDQPSPVSVLVPPFEDDNAAHESFGCMKGGHLGPGVPLKSNLIDKSPRIESMARTLSWDDPCAEVASPYPLKPLIVSSDTKVEEQHWLLLVEKLLSAAALDDQVPSDSFYSKWHSLESPLDPSLRDKYANLNDKEPQPLHEAKRRHMRSNQKLVFDCVNVALMEITGHGSEKYFMGRMRSGDHSRVPVPEGASTLLVDLIVAQMKELIARGMRCALGDRNSLVVESVVRNEAVGKGWVEIMGLEMDLLGREIEGKLMEELVEMAVVDFTLLRLSSAFSF